MRSVDVVRQKYPINSPSSQGKYKNANGYYFNYIHEVSEEKKILATQSEK